MNTVHYQGPKYSGALSITAGEEHRVALVLPGEVSASELAMPQPLVLWCSTGNPGAEDFAKELAANMAGGEDSIRVVTRKPHKQAFDDKGEPLAMLLYLNKVLGDTPGHTPIATAAAQTPFLMAGHVGRTEPEQGTRA